MAGHSKWSNIKHKKKINDNKKSKLFSKLTNEIKTSLKEDNNSNKNKLKNIINKALNNNLNKSTINKIINKNKNIENNYEKILIPFQKNEYILIIEIFKLKNEKNNKIIELKNIVTQYKFNYNNNKNIFENFFKVYKIQIKNEYNEKFINSLNDLKIINFTDNIININENFDKFEKIKKLKNISVSNELIISAKKIQTKNLKIKEEINLLIKKLKKKEFVKNIYTNTNI